MSNCASALQLPTITKNQVLPNGRVVHSRLVQGPFFSLQQNAHFPNLDPYESIFDRCCVRMNFILGPISCYVHRYWASVNNIGSQTGQYVRMRPGPFKNAAACWMLQLRCIVVFCSGYGWISCTWIRLYLFMIYKVL